MEDGNVSFYMKRKGQYGRIVFCVKITELFILFILKHRKKCYCIPSLLRTPVLYSVLVLLLMEILILFI